MSSVSSRFMPLGNRFPHQESSPISIPFSAEQRQNRRPSIASLSSTSTDRSNDHSHTSFPSTAPSSVTSSNPPGLPAAMDPIDYGYKFYCEFEFVGCHLSFHPTQLDPFIEHTASHFIRHPPPSRTICIFCDRTFENSNDPVGNWRSRMRHIADHYRHFEHVDDTRPDFFIIDYMRKKRIISSEDYKWATRHSERHACDGLVDFGYKTSDMKRKEAKALEERYDLEKEDRHRRRHGKGKGKGK